MTTDGTALSAAARKVLPLAIKWSNHWKVPTSFVMAICEIESSFKSDAHNSSAVAQGGAWGLMQVTKTTADTLVHRLDMPLLPKPSGGTALTDAPLHRQIIWAKWRASDASCLLDPDLNVMLGTHYLGKFVMEFGRDLGKIAAAYHNGAGFLRLFLSRDRNTFPSDMPPKGKLYVMRALVARGKYADEDDTPGPILAMQSTKKESPL